MTFTLGSSSHTAAYATIFILAVAFVPVIAFILALFVAVIIGILP
jgi:hypothetical protein